jgi:hypothetical protein
MEEIAEIAERKVADRATLDEIRKLTSRYIAYLAMTNLVIYRRTGARLFDVLRKTGEWRNILHGCSWTDFIATMQVRTLGRILLPTSVVRFAIKLGFDKRI